MPTIIEEIAAVTFRTEKGRMFLVMLRFSCRRIPLIGEIERSIYLPEPLSKGKRSRNLLEYSNANSTRKEGPVFLHIITLGAILASTCQTDEQERQACFDRCARGIQEIARRAPCPETVQFAKRPVRQGRINGIVAGQAATAYKVPITLAERKTVIGVVPLLEDDLPKTDVAYAWFQNPASLANGLSPNELAIKVSDAKMHSDWYLGLIIHQWDAIRSNSHNRKWRAIKRGGKLLALMDKRYGQLLTHQLKNLPRGPTVARCVPQEIDLDSRSPVPVELSKIFQPKSPLELQQITSLFYFDLFMHHAAACAPNQKLRFAWENGAVERLRAIRWPLSR